jgi:uncharacterized protein YndB with AHSA1/START domain
VRGGSQLNGAGNARGAGRIPHCGEDCWERCLDNLEAYLDEVLRRENKMAPQTNSSAGPDERSLVITRTFNLPRDIVFRAWLDPDAVRRWWGPRGFTCPVCEIDARPGGEMKIVMRGPDGADYPMRGVFREIQAPARITFSNSAIDSDGNTLIEGVTTATFEERGGATVMTLQTGARAVAAGTSAMLDGMESGWTETIDRLVDFLAHP